jgi:type II secretory pathway component GspD/PulD (secretin)
MTRMQPMKTTLFAVALAAGLLTSAPAADKGATKLMSEPSKPRKAEIRTHSSLDRADARTEEEVFPAGGLRFQEAELLQVLAIYQDLSGRTLVRSSSLPSVRISLTSQTPLSRRESLQLLDTVLAQNGITMIPLGSKFVKAVVAAEAHLEPAPVIELPREELPESSSFLMYIVQLKHRKPSDVVSALQPFASRVGSSVVGINDGRILILRDYAANVRRMLTVLEKLEQSPGDKSRSQKTSPAE